MRDYSDKEWLKAKSNKTEWVGVVVLGLILFLLSNWSN